MNRRNFTEMILLGGASLFVPYKCKIWPVGLDVTGCLPKSDFLTVIGWRIHESGGFLIKEVEYIPIKNSLLKGFDK